MKKLLTLLCLCCLCIGSVWGEEYTELFNISSGSVVSGTSYKAHSATVDKRDWIVTFGGNNTSVGTNSSNRSKCNLSSYEKYAVSPVTISSTATAFVSLSKIDDVSKISYEISGSGKNQSNTNVYLIYSADGNTFSQISLTSGNQGAAISSGTAFEFAECSGYFGLLFSATNSSGDWRIDGVTMNFYKKEGTTTETVAAPTFSVAEGTYTEAQSVELSCETEGATIMYSIDNGTTWNNYSFALSISATTTILAKAVKDGMNESSVASATYKIVAPLATMDAIFEAATTAGKTATDVVVTFNNWVVSGVNDKNVYVTDGTKGFIIYQSNHGFEVGDVLSGTVNCKVQLYNGSAELTGLTSSTDGLTVTTGGTLPPAEKTVDQLSGINTGAVVTINNLKYDGTNLTAGDYSIKPYDQLYSDMSFTTNMTYNVTGVYLQYNSTKEIMPRSADDIVEHQVQKYTITIAGISNGTVTASLEEAAAGVPVTLTVTPAENYNFTSWTVTDEDNNNITVTNNKFTMPASNVTVSATFVEKTKYAIAWSVNGEVTSAEVYEGTAVTAPTEITVPSYSDKVFVGWVTSETVDASEAPTFVTPTTATANVTYYAVFAKAIGGGESIYQKVTETPSDWTGQYLIVYEGENGNVAFDGSLETLDAVSNTKSVEISDGKIAATTEMDAIAFTVAYKTGSTTVYSLKSASGKYISGTTTNAKAANGIKQATTDEDYEISFSGTTIQSKSSDQQMQLKYNKASDQNRFRFYKSGQEDIALYKRTAGTTYSDYCTTITIPEASIECADLIELASTESGLVPFSVTLTAIDDMDVYLFSDAECTQDITETCDWFDAQFNDASLNVDYYALANPLHTTRTVYMQLFALDSDANEITKVVTVIQAASTDPYLNIADNLNVEADEQSLSTTATMCNIKDNYSLTLSLETGCDWITNLNFDGNDVTFDVAANTANSPREATITWTYAPVQPQGVDAPEYTGTFTVAQAAAEIYNLIQTLADNTTTKSYVEQGGNVTLTDAGINSVEITEDIEDVNITYTRSFGNTNWQAWYMPFEIDPADLPEGFEVAYINDNHIVDGDIKIEIVALEAGQVMKANHPYVIKAPAADTYDIQTTSTLYQTKENTIDCSSTTNMFYFNGTYQLTSMDNVVGKPYGLSGGKFTSLEGYDSKPYRFYMNIVPRDGSQYITLPNEIKLVNVFGEDLDDADAISEIKSESVREGAYDLMGRKATSLVKGNVYIINGKKVLFK